MGPEYYRAVNLRNCHRFRIIFVVILCLLFQQVATAAYACTLTRMPVEPVAMAQDCAEMGMQQAQSLPALCQKHCVPDLSITADHAVPGVPALALPSPAFAVVLSQPVSHAALAVDVPIDRSDPPPRLRYCSLLI